VTDHLEKTNLPAWREFVGSTRQGEEAGMRMREEEEKERGEADSRERGTKEDVVVVEKMD